MSQLSALPFGFRFVEGVSESPSIPPPMRYNENRNCTEVQVGDEWVPLAATRTLFGLTQTITENREAPEDGEDEHNSVPLRLLMTQTATKVVSEGQDDGDDGKIALMLTTTVTVTRAREEPEDAETGTAFVE